MVENNNMIDKHIFSKSVIVGLILFELLLRGI